mgnify:CR=1 FL=1
MRAIGGCLLTRVLAAARSLSRRPVLATVLPSIAPPLQVGWYVWRHGQQAVQLARWRAVHRGAGAAAYGRRYSRRCLVWRLLCWRQLQGFTQDVGLQEASNEAAQAD